jgi:hypothetical protein
MYLEPVARYRGWQEYKDIHSLAKLKKLRRDKTNFGAANTLGDAFD